MGPLARAASGQRWSDVSMFHPHGAPGRVSTLLTPLGPRAGSARAREPHEPVSGRVAPIGSAGARPREPAITPTFKSIAATESESVSKSPFKFESTAPPLARAHVFNT